MYSNFDFPKSKAEMIIADIQDKCIENNLCFIENVNSKSFTECKSFYFNFLFDKVYDCHKVFMLL